MFSSPVWGNVQQPSVGECSAAQCGGMFSSPVWGCSAAQCGGMFSSPGWWCVCFRVKQIQSDLGTQIMGDFEEAFQGAGAKLHDACYVVNILDPKVKRDLLAWFVKLQLSEYLVLFAEDQDVAWLDKIDRRYAWIKRTLVDFEEKFGHLFPAAWEVSERICVEFCQVTCREVGRLMGRRAGEVDVRLLLFAIHRTTGFEALAARRFTGATLTHTPNKPVPEAPPAPPSTNPFEQEEANSNPFESDPASTPTPAAAAANRKEGNKNMSTPFTGIISRCFEPHLSIYIESQDRNLSEQMVRFLEELGQQSPRHAGSEEGSNVLGSCADLFVFYKQCMVQCSQLSTAQPMIHLTRLFQKYLKEYAHRVLLANLPKLSKDSGSLGGWGASGLIQSNILMD
ncbi:hypothetical protein ACOMHN_048252 [Nucella lapillus]